MNKSMILGIGLVLLVAVVGGGFLFFNQNQQDSSTPTQPLPQGVPGSEINGTEVIVGEHDGDTMMEAEVNEIVVEASNFEFTPSAFSVKAGDKVSLTLKVVEGFHDLVIEELDGVATNQIQADGEETIEFTVPEGVDSLTFFCSVGNHRALGMEGTITVN